MPFNIIIIDFPDNGNYYETPLAKKCMSSWKKVFPNAIFQKILITDEIIEKENSPYINFFKKCYKSFYSKWEDGWQVPLKSRIFQRASDLFRLIELNKFDNAIYMDADVYLNPEFINYFIKNIYEHSEFFMGKMLGTFIWNKKKDNIQIQNIIDYFNTMPFLRYDPEQTMPYIAFDWGAMQKYYNEIYKYPTDFCSNFNKDALAGLSFQKDILHPNENRNPTDFIDYKNFINTIDLNKDFESLRDFIQNRRFKIVSKESESILKELIPLKYSKAEIKSIDTFKDFNLKPIQFPSGDFDRYFLYVTLPNYKDSNKMYTKETVILDICILCCDKDYQNLPSLIKYIFTYKPIPHITISVWDNSENKKAESLIQQCKLQYPNETINYYTLGYNVYQFEGRKRLIENSKSDYIWFVDADDEIMQIPDDFLNHPITYYKFEETWYKEAKDILEDHSKKENWKPKEIWTTDHDGNLKDLGEFIDSISLSLWHEIIQTGILKYIVTYFIPNEIIKDTLSEDCFYNISSFLVANYEATLPLHFSTKKIYRYINTKDSISNVSVLPEYFEQFKTLLLDFGKVLKLKYFICNHYAQDWQLELAREFRIFTELLDSKKLNAQQEYELLKLMQEIFGKENIELNSVVEDNKKRIESYKKILQEYTKVKEFMDFKKEHFGKFLKDSDILNMAKNVFPDFKYWDMIEF